MTVAFTLCSNNYFAQAYALAQSFLMHNPQSQFYIVLVDKKMDLIKGDLAGLYILEIHTIEANILDLAVRYNIIELNTAVKPHVFIYLLQNTVAKNIYYIDPDIYIYKSFDELNQLLSKNKFILTPHILTPIPLDNKTPQENDFLNYGIYNLGFIGLSRSNEVIEFLKWWKERTYMFGYKNLAKGLFVDQLWINFVTIFFKDAHVLVHPGYNMGPWNLHERTLSFNNETYYVNEIYPLVFFHFSTFNPIKERKLHPVFTRYDFHNRSDLVNLYADYARELLKLNFAQTNQIPCYYVEWRKEQLAKQEAIAYNLLPLKNKISRSIKNVVPKKIRQSLLAFIQA